jgi:putative DNA primase/helicase
MSRQTAAEILAKHGIAAPTAPGQHSTTCPQCSAGRKPEHQKLKCLGVKVDDVGVQWRCCHCDWNGGEFYERRSRSSPFVAEYIYQQANGTPYLKVCKTAAKGFPQFHWDVNQWRKGKPKGTKIPYRLPELVAAAVDTTVYVCEGEKDADSAARIGLVATTASEGASAKWKPELNRWFKDRRVVILVDADAPGRVHGQQVAKALHGVAASVRVVDLYPGENSGRDVSDWLAQDSAGVKLLAAVQDTPEWDPGQAKGDTGVNVAADPGEALIAELSRLGGLAYEARRVEAAAQLGGIRVSALDTLVRQARSQDDDEQAALPHWQVEPWNDSVPGGELLDAVKRVFEKYTVLPKGAAVALALWVLHAWTMDAGDTSPYLVLVSPTKRCGKTTVLIVLLYLTPRSELAGNISASALFRYIEEVRPTLLIDEADSFLNDNEEARGILNCGHTKATAYVIRSVEVNGEHKARRFSAWAAKAIATIRSLADTLEDRSVVVQLQRKPKAASVARLRKRDSAEFGILRRKAARWADDNSSLLTDPDPAIPESLNDRAADNWRPLLAIADLAGGDWPAQARDAACLLSGEGHDVPSVNVRLLADIREAFGDAPAIRSIDLVAKLTADPERPWVEWGRNNKPLTQKQLGGLLSDFKIASETVSLPGLPDAKGYKRIRFEGVWEAYLPGQNTPAHQNQPSEASKRRNAGETGTTCDFQSVAEGIGDGSENANLPLCHAGSDASTLWNGGNGGEGYSDQGPEPSPDLELPPWEEPQIRVSPEDRRPPEGDMCAQCRGPVDGREHLVATADTTVWLHPECERPYLKEYSRVESPNGPPPDPWADYPALPASLDRTDSRWLSNGRGRHE